MYIRLLIPIGQQLHKYGNHQYLEAMLTIGLAILGMRCINVKIKVAHLCWQVHHIHSSTIKV